VPATTDGHHYMDDAETQNGIPFARVTGTAGSHSPSEAMRWHAPTTSTRHSSHSGSALGPSFKVSRSKRSPCAPMRCRVPTIRRGCRRAISNARRALPPLAAARNRKALNPFVGRVSLLVAAE
jgi:hypothetical protein